MPATQCYQTIRGQAMRLTAVDACGVPIIGAKSVVTSDGFISIKYTLNYEDGEDTSQKNAAGKLCAVDKAPDVLKDISAELTLCGVDPDMVYLTTGQGVVVDHAGNTVGVSIGDVDDDAFFALEVWTDIIGAGCAGGGRSWGYFLLPFFSAAKIGDITIEEKKADFTLSATTRRGNGWGTGPYNVVLHAGVDPAPPAAGKLLTAIGTNKQLHMQTTKVAPPTPACGATALSA